MQSVTLLSNLYGFFSALASGTTGRTQTGADCLRYYAG